MLRSVQGFCPTRIYRDLQGYGSINLKVGESAAGVCPERPFRNHMACYLCVLGMFYWQLKSFCETVAVIHLFYLALAVFAVCALHEPREFCACLASLFLSFFLSFFLSLFLSFSLSLFLSFSHCLCLSGHVGNQ